MKRIALLLLALIIALLSFSGCAKKENPVDEELPKMASDREVLKIWDDYRMLEGVPRFKGTGIFSAASVNEEGVVSLTYFGVEPEVYVDYTNSLKSDGFTLEPDSAIWMAEGLSGYPLFTRGEKHIALVWSLNGVFMISVY